MPKLTLIVALCCIFGKYCRFDVNHLKSDSGPHSWIRSELVFSVRIRTICKKSFWKHTIGELVSPCPLTLQDKNILSLSSWDPQEVPSRCSLAAACAVPCPACTATFAAPSPVWVAKVTGEGEKPLCCCQDQGT